jgi:hypothetical protein
MKRIKCIVSSTGNYVGQIRTLKSVMQLYNVHVLQAVSVANKDKGTALPSGLIKLNTATQNCVAIRLIRLTNSISWYTCSPP